MNSRETLPGCLVDAIVRKAIRRRWRNVSRHRMVHDDGSFLVATERGWYLHSADGVSKHGPFEYGDDGKNFHSAMSRPQPPQKR